MSENRKHSRFVGYYLEYFKKGLIVPALLIALLPLSVLIFEYTFGFKSEILENDKLTLFMLIYIGYYTVLTFLYFYLTSSEKSVTMLDAAITSGIFISLAIAAVIFLVNKDYKIWKFIAVGVGFVACLIAKVLSIFNYSENPTVKQRKPKSIIGYFKKVEEKYSFINIFILSAIIVAAVYIYLNGTYKITLDKQFIKFALICSVPIFFYLIFGLSDPRIHFGDAFILSADISALPLYHFLVSQHYTGEALKVRLIGAIGVTLLAIFMTFIRLMSFDLSKQELPISKNKFSILDYFNKVHEKFNITSFMALGSLIAVVTLFLFRYTNLIGVIPSKTDTFTFAPTLQDTPILIVEFVSHAFLIYSATLALFNIKNKNVTYADALLIMCLSYTVCGLVSFIYKMSSKGIIILPAVMLYLLVILGCRIKLLSMKKDN